MLRRREILQSLLRAIIILPAIAFLLSVTIVGCIDSDDPSLPPLMGPSPATPEEDVVFTIGNLSDLTGVSSNSMVYINMAMENLIEYYNENNLIPGVELKIVTYNGQADLIFTPIPATPITLKHRADRDEVVLFGLFMDEEWLRPPGYVFNLGIDPKYDAYTILKRISENDWDYRTKGLAKVGGSAWSEIYSNLLLAVMKEYCSAHRNSSSGRGHLTDFGFNWTAEVEVLKACDYVYPCIVMKSFVEHYREAGYTEAKFIVTETQAAFFGMIDDAELWDEIDGMLFLKFPRWWN